MTKNISFGTRSLLIGAISIAYLNASEVYGWSLGGWLESLMYKGPNFADRPIEWSPPPSAFRSDNSMKDTENPFSELQKARMARRKAIENILSELQKARENVVFKAASIETQIKDDLTHYKEPVNINASEEFQNNGKAIILGLSGKVVLGGYPTSNMRLSDLVGSVKERGQDSTGIDKIYIKATYIKADVDHAEMWARRHGLTFDPQEKSVEGKLNPSMFQQKMNSKDRAIASGMRLDFAGAETHLNNKIITLDHNDRGKVIDAREFDTILKIEAEKMNHAVAERREKTREEPSRSRH